MTAEIIVAPRSCCIASPRARHPHLIYYRGEIRVVRKRAWDSFYRGASARVIMSRADLAEIDPEALNAGPDMLADLLSVFGNDLLADPPGDR